MEEKLKSHIQWFDKWAAKKIAQANDPEPLELKREHTHNVLQNGLAIADADFNREEVFLATLYHDLGRFDQYLRYGTFRDATSINHAAEAVKILKREKRLGDMGKSAQKILTAILLHNRPALPQSLSPDILALCNIIRDADKLDILRVIDTHLSSAKEYHPTIILGLPDAPENGNPEIVENTLAGVTSSYGQLRNLNDFRLLLGAWFFDMHSKASKELYAKAGHGRALVQGLPDNAHYGLVKARLLASMDSYG